MNNAAHTKRIAKGSPAWTLVTNTARFDVSKTKTHVPMYLRSLILLSPLIFFFFSARAQDSTLFLAFEAGAHSVGCERVRKDYLRGDNPPSTLFAPKITSELTMRFAGIKVQKITSNEKFGLATGIRFTGMQSRIFKTGFSDFFFLLHRQTGTTTEYLKVRELEEVSYYIGIPLELRMYTNKARRTRWFFMAGAEWNLQLGTKVNVYFDDPAMDIYESDVREIAGDSNPWYASFYIGAGLILGKDRPRFTLGLSAPLVITKTVSSLNIPTAGMGMQIQYLIPLNI